MTEDKTTLHRLNARIGHTQNAWLDAESARTGISKSGLVQLAVEQYIAQKQALDLMSEGFPMMLEKMDEIQKNLEKIQE